MLVFCITGSGISGSTIANHLKKNIKLKSITNQEVYEFYK